jgi:lysophospholipase L1-like esterase
MLKPRLIFSFWWLASLTTHAQDTVRFAVMQDYGLVDYSNTIISNPQQLKPFFEKLYALKAEKKGTINILHLGDSHIQGGYLTQQVRINLQQAFGNAGRGFVVPARVAGTNEPYSYKTESNVPWEAKRMVFPDQPLPIGLGGITIRTQQEQAQLNLRVFDAPTLDYGFNRITTFFLKEPNSYHAAVQDTLGNTLAYIGSFAGGGWHAASTALPGQYKNLTFQLLKGMPAHNRFTLFGFNVENGKPGILHHAVGVNGAKYKHYLTTDFLLDQTALLKPDLIVLALGTNEALDHPFVEPKLHEQVSTLIQQLSRINPQAVFLISIHPDSFKKKIKKNPGVTAIREKLIDYATEKSLPYFDLYAAGGGKHSAERWAEAKLLREDGVHFTRAGYELQGNMFYLALMRAYNAYVRDRR